ncbi:MAG: NTP transferase domain-containing protein [Actinomycetota bacterium]|nr:NTP transferase domain-containing protein [Actinomycetota bacterium]
MTGPSSNPEADVQAETPQAGLAAVVLAAGAGRRLRPLTELRPKALCTVDNVPLVDLAIGRARQVTEAVAVNVHHGRAQLEAYLAGRVHVSLEEPEALETAGALGHLRSWIDSRDVLVVNVDVWHPEQLSGFARDWDRERVRLLVVHDPERGDFGDLRYAGVALLPWAVVRQLSPRRHGLYPAVLGPAVAEGWAEFVTSPRPFFDCGTPPEYLAANLTAAGGSNVVGEGAVVEGEIVRSVVWAHARVERGERLIEAIRAPEGITVQTRLPHPLPRLQANR